MLVTELSHRCWGPAPPPSPPHLCLGPLLRGLGPSRAGASLAFKALPGPSEGASKSDCRMIHPSLPRSPSRRCQLPAFKNRFIVFLL